MGNAFAKDFESQSSQTLYTKMRKTAKARFNCAKRLGLHQTFSLWTVSLFSVGLIGITLLSLLHIPTNVGAPFYDLLQVMLALLILVLSLLLSGNKYSERAEKMHRCGLEISRLFNHLLPNCAPGKDDPHVYVETLDKYSEVLSSHENHADIDFDLVRLELSEEYPLGFFQRSLIRIRYVLGFWLYLGLLFLLLAAFLSLLWPTSASHADQPEAAMNQSA